MNKLISKIQYSNCEPGEFKEEIPRSYDEILQIINHFPWESQREKLRVSPTNPSVTLQYSDLEYLKLAVYFNGKYVLYYFRNDRKLYYKSFVQKEDSYEYLKSFYNSTFTPADFRSESRWFPAYAIHFISRDFKYSISPKRIRSYLISTSAVNFCMGIFLLVVLLAPHRTSLPVAAILFFVLYVFLLGGGLNLLVFFNYYRYVKDKMLIMSKAEDLFYFGEINKPKAYNKKDITGIIIYRNHNYRSPVASFVLVEIELSKDASILIPNLMIEEEELLFKLTEYPKTDKPVSFPVIKTKVIQLAG